MNLYVTLTKMKYWKYFSEKKEKVEETTFNAQNPTREHPGFQGYNSSFYMHTSLFIGWTENTITG